jgi:hypothetical protein
MHSETLDPRLKIGTFLLLICCFFCLYTLTFNGAFRVDDEHILAARTQSLALFGELSEPQVYGNQRVQALIPLGDPATQIEPGQAMLGAILVRIAQSLGFGITQALFSLNSLITSLCVGLVFLIVSQLGYSRRVSIWCAVLFGAGSMAWPYAQTYFRDTLAMTMSALVFLGWARLQHPQADKKWSAYVLIGFGALAGVLAKNNVAVLLVALGVVGLVRWLHSSKSRAVRVRGILTVSTVVLGVLGILLLLPEDGPFARFSLDYYYFLAQYFLGSLNVDLLAALAGPFISPGKSIFLFSPPLLIGLIAVRRILKKEHSGYTLLALLFTLFLAIAQGLFYRERWAGGFGWGLKYMLPALPALFSLLAPAVDSLLNAKSSKSRVWLYVILALSVLVQLGAVLVPWNRSYDHWQALGTDPYVVSAAWKVRFLAIPTQVAGLFSFGQWETAWQRLFPSNAIQVVSILLLALTLLALSIWGIQRLESRLWTGRRYLIVFTLSILILLPIATWWAAAGDPAWGDDHAEFDAVLSAVRDDISAKDVILLDSYGTSLWYFWMNRWDLPQRWYSLPFSISGVLWDEDEELATSAEVEGLILKLNGRADSIWYVTSNETADYSVNPDRSWIESQLSLDFCQRFDGGYQVVVCRFSCP